MDLPLRPALLLAALLAAGGCAAPPDTGAGGKAALRADYPVLLPLDELVDAATLPADPGPGLAARTAALRSRAAALRAAPL